MRKTVILVTMLLITAVCLSALALSAEQKALSEKLIRLHVVANSDSDYDQSVKLKVRDAVLQKANALLADSENPDRTLVENLQVLADTAQAELCKLNYRADIHASYQKERFPTRRYDTFSLPAGAYKTLRITIGSGRGHNWWCVVYPSLCLTASMGDLEQAATAANFSQGEISLITEERPQYVFRFKTLEILENLKRKLFP